MDSFELVKIFSVTVLAQLLTVILNGTNNLRRHWNVVEESYLSSYSFETYIYWERPRDRLGFVSRYIPLTCLAKETRRMNFLKRIVLLPGRKVDKYIGHFN